jgi:hypothetical protein
MEKTVSQSILHGRPFGSAGILLNKKLSGNVVFENCSERFTVIVVGSVVLISLYLPSIKNNSEIDVITDNLTMIECSLSNFPSCSVVVGADLNIDLSCNTESATVINNFLHDHSLSICDNLFSSKNTLPRFTYCHESLQNFSYIDYLLVSSDL